MGVFSDKALKKIIKDYTGEDLPSYLVKTIKEAEAVVSARAALTKRQEDLKKKYEADLLTIKQEGAILHSKCNHLDMSRLGDPGGFCRCNHCGVTATYRK